MNLNIDVIKTENAKWIINGKLNGILQKQGTFEIYDECY